MLDLIPIVNRKNELLIENEPVSLCMFEVRKSEQLLEMGKRL